MTARLSHLDAGSPDAPLLLLGSSLGTTGAMWEPQLPALSARFRVVAFDHRGHGGSDVPPTPYDLADLGRDVLALADSLGAERFSYAGLSLGGMVGMWLAAAAPDRVERLALLCTSAQLGPEQAWRDRAAAVRRGGTATVADAVVGRWFTPPYAAAHPDVVDRHRAMLVDSPDEGYAGCCEAIAVMDLRPALGDITAPTLVVAGADDTSTPPEHARAIAAGITGSRLEVVPSAAHLANVEQADTVTRLLLDHLGEG